MSRLDDIKHRAEKFADLCPDYMYRAIRHLERNCEIECAREELDENHCCIHPDRYDGEAMAVALSDLAALVAAVEEVQRIRDTMRAEEGLYEYPEERFGDLLDEALHPLMGQTRQAAQDRAVNQLIVAASGVDPDTAARLGYPTKEAPQ